MKSEISEILNGAIDMHMHVYPEFDSGHPLRYDNLEHMRICRDAGMRGLVLKSHAFPTTLAADVINEAVPGFQVFGSFTMNTYTGGIDPFAVEIAIETGAKSIWLPTTTSRNDASRGNVRADFLPILSKFKLEQALYLLDEDGGLIPEVKEVIALCKDYDVVLQTGHISAPERMAVAVEAHNQGFKKLVFSHPDSGSTKGTYEEIMEMARLGCYIELVVNGMMPNYQRISTATYAKWIKDVGYQQILIDTDYFPTFDYLPSLPEMLRLLYGCLITKGVTAKELKQIASVNPAQLLNLSV